MRLLIYCISVLHIFVVCSHAYSQGQQTAVPYKEYSLHYRSAGSTSMHMAQQSDSVQKPQSNHFQIDAQILLREVPHKGLECRVVSARVRYVVNEQVDTTLSERISSEMRSVFFIGFDSSLAIDTIIVPEEMSADCSNLALSVLSLLQGPIVYKTCNQNPLARSMHDRLGVFRSHERCIERSKEFQVHSLRRGYLLAKADRHSYNNYMQQRNSLSGVRDDYFHKRSGLLQLREGCDTQRVYLASQLLSESIANYTFRFCEQRYEAAAAPLRFRSLPLPEVANERQVRRSAMQQLMAHSSVDGLMDTLRTLKSHDSSVAQSIEPLLRAAAFLHASMCDSLAVLSEALELSDERQLLIADVLSRSELPSAQRYLRTLISRCTNDFRTLALILPSFAALELPDSASVELILESAFAHPDAFVRSTAQLCIGSMIHLQYGSHPELSSSLVRSLLQHRKELDDEQFLYIMGNAGRALRVEHFLPFVDTANLSIRRLALQSLRFVPDPGVDSILASALSDADTLTQWSVLSSISFRAPNNGLSCALCKYLIADGNERCSKLASSIVRRWIADMPCVDESACVQYWIEQCLTQLNATASQRAILRRQL